MTTPHQVHVLATNDAAPVGMWFLDKYFIINGSILILFQLFFRSNNNNNRRLVTLAEHTSDHGRQTNSSTEEKGEQV